MSALLLPVALAAGRDTATLRLTAPDGGARIDAAPHAHYLLRPANESFQHVAALPPSDWRHPETGILSLGYQARGAWVRVPLVNADQPADAWLLVLDIPTLERVELRVHDPLRDQWSATQVAGSALRSTERPMRGRYPVFPLHLPPGETRVVYLRATSFDRLNIPLHLTLRHDWRQQEAELVPLLGAFFGAMLAMLIYNGSLWIFTRDRSYFWYCVYLTCSISYTLAMTGLGDRYLWGEVSALSSRLLPIGVCASFAGAGLFIRHFLELPQRGGHLLRISNLLIVYWVAGLAIVAVAPHWFPRLGVYAMGFVSCIAALLTAIWRWREGNISARYFTIAWLALYVSTAYVTLALAGLVAMSAVPIYVQLIGFTLEFLLLSIALAERINRERLARLQAQREALIASQALGAERLASLHSQQAANAELERHVHDRTQALEASNQALAAANALLSELSQRDALTDLHNRRYFDSVLDAHLQLSAEPLGIAMLDIDHFKRINDTWGHAVGDRCIVAVADVLRRHTQRSGECAARFGGEEFVLLFGDTSESALRDRCERIRRDIEALHVDHGSARVTFTVSIGAVCWHPDPADQPRAYVERADAALYRAKAEGRNRVCLAT